MSNSAGSALQFQPHTGGACPGLLHQGRLPLNPIKFAYSRLTVQVEFTAPRTRTKRARTQIQIQGSAAQDGRVRDTDDCTELEKQSGLLFVRARLSTFRIKRKGGIGSQVSDMRGGLYVKVGAHSPAARQLMNWGEKCFLLTGPKM